MHPNQVSDFYFDLPKNLIAQYPLKERSASKLLYLNRVDQSIRHFHFPDILNLIQPADLLIFNNTKVIPARLLGRKLTGGKIECLIERVLSSHSALAHIKGGKSLRLGSAIQLPGNRLAKMKCRQGEFFELIFEMEENLLDYLNQYGAIPLPPYIERNSEESDHERYQTVYACRDGAVAAPTAGLHFDKNLMEKIKSKGIATEYITLHVGAGTFQPVRVAALDQHQMHSEYMEVSEAVCQAIANCRARGGRIIAVGTTVVRCLESAAQNTLLKPYSGETNIFIRPGYRFNCVDALITNFHLPGSTLLMLVSAFAGYDYIKNAYQTAIVNQYRFFSYGDAMFIA